MTRLKNETLAAVGAQLSIPQYDRSKLKPGILHVGVGNFHRAHQAIYLDALQNLDFDPEEPPPAGPAEPATEPVAEESGEDT